MTTNHSWEETWGDEIGDCISTSSPENFARVKEYIRNLLSSRDVALREAIERFCSYEDLWDKKTANAFAEGALDARARMKVHILGLLPITEMKV